MLGALLTLISVGAAAVATNVDHTMGIAIGVLLGSFLVLSLSLGGLTIVSKMGSRTK